MRSVDSAAGRQLSDLELPCASVCGPASRNRSRQRPSPRAPRIEDHCRGLSVPSRRTVRRVVDPKHLPDECREDSSPPDRRRALSAVYAEFCFPSSCSNREHGNGQNGQQLSTAPLRLDRLMPLLVQRPVVDDADLLQAALRQSCAQHLELCVRHLALCKHRR